MENTCKKGFRFSISNLEPAPFPQSDLMASHGNAVPLCLQLSCSAHGNVLSGGDLVAYLIL